jgi:hypothetical protein
MTIHTLDLVDLSHELTELTDKRDANAEREATLTALTEETIPDPVAIDEATGELEQFPPLDYDEALRLEELEALHDELSEVGGIHKAASHGIGLVDEDSFEEFARDYAHGISDIDVIDGYVDWGRFAADLVMDYRQIDFENRTYYTRDF